MKILLHINTGSCCLVIKKYINYTENYTLLQIEYKYRRVNIKCGRTNLVRGDGFHLGNLKETTPDF